MRVVTLTVVLALAAPAAALGWGGTYTVADGTPVRVELSDAYPVDPAVAQGWADYLGSLLHGPELARVTLRLAPFAQVQRLCGLGASGCYAPTDGTIVAAADGIPDGATAREVVAHEYGHHVAANRLNPPWKALTWGTKRWATYVGVCAKTAAHRLFPGDERLNYRVNPGEGFAEAFRFLNELRAGVVSPAWTAVDPLLYPDATALRFLEADVVTPWTGNTALTLGAARARSFTLRTPLDGTLVVGLHAPTGAYRLSLWRGATRVAGGSAFRYAICGERTLTLRVDPTGAAGGAYTIDVSRP
jgi:hypothetical protein